MTPASAGPVGPRCAGEDAGEQLTHGRRERTLELGGDPIGEGLADGRGDDDREQ